MQVDRDCSLFTKCCFCIPLRTGCFILGYLSLLLNLVITLFFVGSLAIMAILTHGFRYLHLKQSQSGDMVPDEDPVDKAKLHMTIVLVILVGFLNVGWLMLNAFLLVGLHKKRPGPIKLHVTVATIRLLLSVLGLVTVHTTRTATFCWIEISLSAYFIMMYYAYAMQLERDLRVDEGRPTQELIADLVFNHTNTDKEILTDKNNIQIIPV
ncbi:uncharacterized protein LOC142980731 isoform X2 [Anticarsia gemmatalis]